MEQVKTEELATYNARSDAADEAIIKEALGILSKRLKTRGDMDSPSTVRQYLQLRIGGERAEKFGVMFLDTQNRLIECVDMFNGTLTQASVFPREIVRAALEKDASAVVLYHNHPSGTLQPSRQDEVLTKTLATSLALVDVRVLEHIIVAPNGSYSFAEHGLI